MSEFRTETHGFVAVYPDDEGWHVRYLSGHGLYWDKRRALALADSLARETGVPIMEWDADGRRVR